MVDSVAPDGAADSGPGLLKFGLSQPVPRREDPRLLTGRGRFTDDDRPETVLHGAVLRATHAHARIVWLDVTAARGAPGVRAVYTAADLEEAGIQPIECESVPAVKPGTQFAPRAQPALAGDVLRYCGEALAFVVAESIEQARDALEAIEVELEPLPAVTDCEHALVANAPAVWEHTPRNVAFEHESGDERAASAAIAAAARCVAFRAVNNRVVLSPIETRGALGCFEDGRLVLHTGTQMPNPMKLQIARAFGVEDDRVRVVVADVGGGFGGKNSLYPEQILVLHAARSLGQPVKWMSERAEGFLSDFHGRDNVTSAILGVDEEDCIVGLRIRIVANLGAYTATRGAVPPLLAALMATNCYRIPDLHVDVVAAYTHTVPTDPYRGAGRPEITYFVERLMEHAARELGVDRVAFRRQNLIPLDAFPYHTPSGLDYDTCQFEAVIDTALARSNWTGLAERRRASEAAGRLRGIGMSNYVERCGGGAGLGETASLELGADGMVRVLIGSMSNGQGHETAYSQIVHELTGLPFPAIEIVQGDTDRIATGTGTGGSWSITMGGTATARATEQMVERLKPIAAELLEAAERDVELRDGAFRVSGTDLVRSFQEVAALACDSAPEGMVVESARFEPDNYTFPYGCHICEVEVDPETGVVRMLAYTAVHDFGRALNPLLLAGQVHGGVVQGIGQALHERTVYSEDGQLLSGSFLDYCLPRADDLPSLDFHAWESPAPANPLDIKGCGEAGATGSSPAVINAVVDALHSRGVTHLDMPATPLRVWSALKRSESEV